MTRRIFLGFAKRQAESGPIFPENPCSVITRN